MASIHDLCNPEPEENGSYHSPTLPDYPPGPHPHSHPHHPASYQHGPPPHHYPRYNSEYAEPPPPPPHSSRSHRSSHPHDRHPQHYPPHYKPYPPPPHHAASPQPYPPGPHAPSHPHHRPSSHHYLDQPPPHPSAYEGRHGYDPQYPPRPHSPPPHPSMSGVPHPYDHYPPGPPPPPHHRSQRGYHHERPRNHSRDHAREHSREHPRDHSRDHHPRDQYEQYPSNHHPAPNARVLAPTSSASTGVPPVPGSASNGAANPHPEHRAVKTEHNHQEALRRNAALLDERPARIKIVQQPLHARMCGFGEKDRRPVDPPPIVQLILDEDHEQHPTKRMQRSAAKKAAGDSKDKAEENKEGENGTKEGEDETDQLEEDGNEEKQPDGTATGKTAAAKGRAGSLQKQDSQDAASGTGSSPSLGKRSRPSSSSKSKAKRSGTADDDDDGEKSHSDHSQSGSDDEGDDDNNQHVNGNLQEQDPLFVLHVSLWSADGKEVRNMIATPGQSEPPKLTRILMGSLVVSPILLNNPEGVPGWYFSFPDLSIRTEGVYTLKFSLMRFGSFDFLSNDGGHASTLVAEEISEPFTVFSAKKFPGMTESTELSKAFAKQGLKIPIRNDLRARKTDRDN